MKEIILVKTGEIALKGLNKATFEDMLIKNIRKRLKKIGEFNIRKAQSTLVINPKGEDIDLDFVCDTLSKVFGIAAFSRCLVTEKDMDVIKKDAIEYVRDVLSTAKTFKVVAKRSDKKFPFNSPEIMIDIGGAILEANPHLKVDVHNPEIVVTVEIRDVAAYVHAKVYAGAGGMPVGSAGRALLLVSGGIDSPVAGHMLAKRGVMLSAIHFVSPPYTSQRALQKVEDLCSKLCEYCDSVRFFCVNFTEIQEAIRDNCPEELFTIIMRRIMMKISVEIANREELLALITGESVGQVASQTLNAIAATDAVCTIPVFRP
ncbi:MAG: tRNA uracil 4-sulfurtransferase ThiI, partial [Niameybacter sp.]